MSLQVANPLGQQIQASLQKASAFRNRLKTSSVRYTLMGLVLSALATVIAGVPSLQGEPLIGDSWRLTCAMATVVTLAATIVSGVQSQLAKPDLLTQASECVGKLRALMADTLSPACDWEEARKKYQQVLIDYSGVDL